MNTKRINGYLFEKLLYNGLANLQKMEETLNSLNVFPVADGDTGSNMCLTLANGLSHAKSGENACTYLAGLNEGLLLGARGNSGVILSQLFKGIYLHLSRCAAANSGDMRNAFIRGYKTAYQAVVNPVEGTILTVAREGIENIRSHVDRNTSIEALLAMYIAEMKKSLARTPQLLPALKDSGVVDSGALGYITIIEGMSKYLNGEILEPDTAAKSAGVKPTADFSLDAFNENSVFEEGYCMEFILQLMNASGYLQNFRLDEFIEEMKPFGNSIAVTQEKSRVKVHIHTKEPAWLITLSRKYGEFLTFKLENMQLQHNEHMLKQQSVRSGFSKPLGIIAVANGKGMVDEFKKLGCACVLAGGATMNTSSQEFLQAYEAIDAETVVVLPNSKNVIGAANQAAELAKRGNIHVLPSRSIAEGYFAAAMDIGNTSDTEKRIASIESGLEGVTTIAVALAEKPYADGDVVCAPGDYIAVCDDKVVFAAKDPVEAFLGGLESIEDIGDKESCVLFSGEKAKSDWEARLVERVEDAFSLEISFLPGGQPTYIWVCGII